jgi:hypothetical protein
MNNNYIQLDSFGDNLTSFKFYTLLLERVHQFYHSNDYQNKPPIFTFSGKFFIDSSVVPLLAGLGYHLKSFHQSEIDLLLTNTPNTINLIYFLDQCDFFNIVGDNQNPNSPIGKNIFNFSDAYIGGYYGYIKKQNRKEHKLRCYSPDDKYIKEIVKSDYSDDEKRDFLLEFINGKISDDFRTIFKDKHLLNELSASYLSILTELTVNGVFHSKAPVFVMAQSKIFKDESKQDALVDLITYKTTISVVDVGVGFYNSLVTKQEEDYKYFKKFEIINFLKKKNPIIFNDDISSIFETLCFSMSQKREGLFDLIINCFLDNNDVFQGQNYFRIHNKSSQIIFSYKYKSIIEKLKSIRKTILKNIKISDSVEILKSVNEGKEKIIELAEIVAEEYSSNIQISSLRKYDVELPGVHIEIEIIEKKWEERL